MFGRTKCWGMVAAMACSSTTIGFATEPIVQEFDGWKITITPGPSSRPDVPPSPAVVTSKTASASSGSIQLVSLRQDVTPLAPVPVLDKDNSAPVPGTPVADPAIDGLPVIIPGESSHCCDSTPTVSAPEGTVDPRYLAQMYQEIYKSIPFIRAEYDGNPTYIHDTAVEFLFGKMRPTVIHRGTTNVNQNHPHGYGVPYAYGGWGYAYPPLQLVVPGTGLRIHRSY